MFLFLRKSAMNHTQSSNRKAKPVYLKQIVRLLLWQLKLEIDCEYCKYTQSIEQNRLSKIVTSYSSNCVNFSSSFYFLYFAEFNWDIENVFLFSVQIVEQTSEVLTFGFHRRFSTNHKLQLCCSDFLVQILNGISFTFLQQKLFSLNTARYFVAENNLIRRY